MEWIELTDLDQNRLIDMYKWRIFINRVHGNITNDYDFMILINLQNDAYM